MKKLTVCILAAMLLMSFNPMPLKAEAQTGPVATAISKPTESTAANVLLNRLNEINLMDKSNLSPSEKKQLRREARSIKKHFKAVSGGVYISAGALIVILILALILL